MRQAILVAVLIGLIAAAVAGAAEPVEKWRYTAAGRGTVYCGVMLADINGDGLPEALIATRDDGRVCAVSGKGKEIFAFHPGDRERFISAVSAADIDGDGQVEVLAAGRDRNLYCLSPKGKPRWTVRMINGGPAFGGPTLADVTGDGRLEMFVNSDSGRLYCVDSAGQTLWTYLAAGGISGIPVAADVDGDGQREVLFGSDNFIYCVDATGALKWRAPTEDEAVGGPVAADLDGDGTAEVLGCGFDGFVRCLNGKDGSQVWAYQTGGPLRNAISVADINGDGKPEVLVAGYKGFFCLDASGKELWKFLPEGVEPRAESAAGVVGDVTGDGKPNIVFAGKNGHVYCLDAAGKLVWERGNEVDYIFGSPALGDVDGDGKVEILYGTALGDLICLGTKAPYLANTMLWPQARGTAVLNASLVEPRASSAGQVVVEAKAGSSGKGTEVNFVALPTYPSYRAMGTVLVYAEAKPAASLAGRTIEVEVTRGDAVLYTRTESARGDRGSVVMELPLGQLLSGTAPAHLVKAQVIGPDGQTEAEGTLSARLLTPEPIAKRAHEVAAALEPLAQRIGTPPVNSPAEFAARLVKAAQYYVAWVRDEMAAGNLKGADWHLTKLEAALPALQKRIEDRIANTQPIEAPGLSPKHIVLDPHGVLLVDGKPVFGSGMYNIDTAKHIETLAPYFNVAVGAGNDEYWRAAAEAHMLVITYLGGESMEDFSSLLQNADRIEKVSQETALLAWYVADEPSARGVTPETMARLCGVVKILDPYHPTLICDGNPNGGERYAAVCDLPMPASYPLWKGMPTIEVADCMDRTIAGVKGKRPVWFVVQAFTGRGVRLPTAAEERNMTYLAIIHGARGLTYFTYREPEASLPGGGFYMVSQSAPETWKAMLEVAKEIQALQPALTAPQRRMEILTKGDGRLDVSVIATQDAIWVLAANPIQQTARWRIAPKELGMRSGQVTLLFESRSLPISEGGFSDEFEPLGVHVYRVAR